MEWLLSVNWFENLGYLAAGLVFTSSWMKTMIPLRLFAIGSNMSFAAYGFLGSLYPIMALHLVLLPLNIYRLFQMQRLIDDVQQASEGKFSMEWAVPHAQKLRLEKDAVLFRNGETADAMYYVLSGQARLQELDIEIGPGEMIGEIAMFAPDRMRTATAVCKTDCEFMVLTLDTVRQLYFQNPTFGFYLVSLITKRLVANLREFEARQRAGGTAGKPAG